MSALDPNIWITSSPGETLHWGERFGAIMPGGLVVGLVGPLGAGKTLVVKGIARGNGVPDDSLVTSPTFTLVQEYVGRLRLFHLDIYRLRHPAELTSLGIDELVRDDTVLLIEWADKFPNALPEEMLKIEIEPTGDTSRKLSISARGATPTTCLNRLLQDRALTNH